MSDGAVIRCLAGGRVVFEDTADHWSNGVCRLLGIDERQGRGWINASAEAALSQYRRSLADLSLEEQIAALRQGAAAIFPPRDQFPIKLKELANPGACGHAPDTVYQQGIGCDDTLAVIGCSICSHGWLVQLSDLRTATVGYERDYFEGATHGLGYGNYLAQQGWRMEKSHRFLDQLRPWLGAKPRALDVGCGYGFFRQAMSQAGWSHDGVELSAHACKMANELFGFQTQQGTIADVAESNYDLLTLWDVIEHVADPADLLAQAARLLRPGGICAIRTPNLLAAERDVFGANYHSFKREHVQYFSPSSVVRLAGLGGLQSKQLLTQSNLLAGFSAANMHAAETALRGADIFAVFAKA